MELLQTELPSGNRTGAFRMFVTDYDGTLLTDHRQIDSQDLRTLERLKACGVTTVIATGRSLFSFERSLKTMGLSPGDLSVDYLVFSTGAGIMETDTGRIIRSLDLGKDEIRQACLYFDRQGFDYMVHGPIPDTPYFQYRTQGGANPDFQARIDLYPGFGSPLKGDLNGQSDLPGKGTEVLAIVPRQQLSLSQKEIQRKIERTSVIFATSPLDHQSVWIEVFHRGASKSFAVAWLSQRLGIGADQVVAVGNDFNDLDLLQWSGMACLVENGPREIGKECIMVRSNNRCGVSHAAAMAGLMA